MKILIVEDEEEIRESLKDFFEDEGFEVTTAANGAEAITSLYATSAPDLVILDLLMPVMSGNEVYERMQGDPVLAKIPVIIMTSDPSRAPPGLLIMRKPMALDRLLMAVRQFCKPPCEQ
jgi:CheY-like chemotaxis protein